MCCMHAEAASTTHAHRRLACDGPKQEALLAAAAVGAVNHGATNADGPAAAEGAAGGQQQGFEGAGAGGTGSALPQVDVVGGEGPGAMLVVPAGSNHNSFDDVLLFYGSIMAPLLKLVGADGGVFSRGCRVALLMLRGSP